MIASIYVLIDPRDGRVRYVGWTTRSLSRRLAEHCCPDKADRSYRANWIRKLRRLGLRPTIQLVKHVLTTQAPCTEMTLIACYRKAGKRLVNGTDGGEGTLGFRHKTGTFDHSHWKSVITAYRQLKSIRRAASVTDVGKTGVEYILKACGVKLYSRIRTGHDNSSRKAIRAGSSSALVRDYGVMHQLYEVERLSTTEIGRELGLASSTVLTGLRQCGIKSRDHRIAACGQPWREHQEHHQ